MYIVNKCKLLKHSPLDESIFNVFSSRLIYTCEFSFFIQQISLSLDNNVI